MDHTKIKDVNMLMHGKFEAVGKQIGNDYYVPLSLLEKGYGTEKVWIEKDKTLKLQVTNARPLEIKPYKYNGNYLHFDKNEVENWNVELDDSGIPITIYPFGKHYNPSTIAHYGLQHYSIFLKDKNERSKSIFLKVADWFINNQDTQGGWAYHFDLPYFPKRLDDVKAPWYSSIGLGMALSVLARAAYLTNNRKYSERARRATTIFKTPSPKGILAKFENKYWFYEECPTDPPSYILNGFMFSLIGLYDLYKASGDDLSKQLYDNGIIALKRMLPLYDLGNRSSYDLTHYTTDGGYPNVAKWGYHITHIHLLAALNTIENDSKLGETLQRWRDYVNGYKVNG
ncbi:D-glucuronyl C5-epimerase family protein [Aquibacillus kalidii]|uniref:D-glucuronyl C5-epimerase family protein n=1 Tax=Aquibacillus kalidii TaxID=2762597 RepID=UPI00164402BC|nr:D-glucuronyl C5-epimerase family protein [Aquibacillus kalidii]